MTVADPMHEIVWLGTLPVAQVSPGDEHFPLRYTYTDHLGTPILQTDPSGMTVWRAEHEPYGQIWTMRLGTRTEQPLRLPGQELAMTWEGQEENYNIFRWYRAGWGRYTQSDPLAVQEPRIFIRQVRPHEFAYSAQDPINGSDPTGLCGKCDNCPSGKWTVDPFGFGASAAFGTGLTYQQTVYTCQDNGYAVKIKTTCAVLGPIVGAGVGVTAPGKACGCNVSDLLSLGKATKGWTGWIGPVNIDINKCTNNDPIATAGGISKSWGAGFAKTWCWSEEKK
jgi:RHS repeat-associated protein